MRGKGFEPSDPLRNRIAYSHFQRECSILSPARLARLRSKDSKTCASELPPQLPGFLKLVASNLKIFLFGIISKIQHNI